MNKVLLVLHKGCHSPLEFVDRPKDVFDANVVLEDMEALVEQDLSAAQGVHGELGRRIFVPFLSLAFTPYKNLEVKLVDHEFQRRQ